MILIFFGPPGAGKGTQASLIGNYFNIPHLSTGDIFRKKLQQSDDIAKKLKIIIESGHLVSDDITNDVVLDRINKKDCSKGFILDGYPRTISQASYLKNIFDLKKLVVNKIIDITVDEHIIVERLKSRSNIEKRDDDHEKIIKIRILKYLSETKPVADYYMREYPSDYHKIKGNQEIEKINRDILKILKNDVF